MTDWVPAKKRPRLLDIFIRSRVFQRLWIAYPEAAYVILWMIGRPAIWTRPRFGKHSVAYLEFEVVQGVPQIADITITVSMGAAGKGHAQLRSMAALWPQSTWGPSNIVNPWYRPQ